MIHTLYGGQLTCICSEGSVDTDRSSYGVAIPETHTHTHTEITCARIGDLLNAASFHILGCLDRKLEHTHTPSHGLCDVNHTYIQQSTMHYVDIIM